MKKIFIADIKNYENQEVTIQAWLYNKRSSGKLHFLQLRDGTAEIQAVVFKGNVSEDVLRLLTKLHKNRQLKLPVRLKRLTVQKSALKLTQQTLSLFAVLKITRLLRKNTALTSLWNTDICGFVH